MSARLTRSVSARSSRRETTEIPRGYGPRASIPPSGFVPDPEEIIRRSNSERRQRASSMNRRTPAETETDEQMKSISWLPFKNDMIGVPLRDTGDSSDDDDLVWLSFQDFILWVEEVEPEREDPVAITQNLSATIENTGQIHDQRVEPELHDQNSQTHHHRPHSSDQESDPQAAESPSIPASLPLQTTISSFRLARDVTSTQASSSSVRERVAHTSSVSLNTSRHEDRHVPEPTSSDDKWSSDDSSSSSISIDSDDNFDAWWGDDIPSVVIRAPTSTDALCEHYANIKEALEAYLVPRYPTFFFAPVVVTPRDREDIPVLVLLFDVPSKDQLPNVNDLHSQIGDYFILVIGRGEFGMTAGETQRPKGTKYHATLECGDGIQLKAKEVGTVGLFVEENEKIVGITAGHVMMGTNPGTDVIQPSLSDFKRQISDIEEQIETKKNQISMTRRRPQNVDILRQEKAALESELTALRSLQGEDDDETRLNLLAGKSLRWELKSVKYKGRRCCSDWGIFQVLPEREPNETPFEKWRRPSTPETHLGSLEWKSVAGWTELDFDQYVRKTGRTTGLTFGFVAGVHAGFINPSVSSRPCSEYYVLQEFRADNNYFAKRGDSGSAVITNEGMVVGFVHSAIEISDVAIVCHPGEPGKEVPDLRKIAERRGSDGEVDLHRLWFSYFTGRSFILVESALMVRERAKLEGEIFPAD